MLITDHFSLSEFVDNETANRRKIDNNPPANAIVRIVNLCTLLLEPLRVKFGAPIHIATGYVSPELSKYVGVDADSPHLHGEAVNICADSASDNMRLFHLIREIGYFDELVCEGYDSRTCNCDYVHVSLRMDGVNHRRSMVRYKGRKGCFAW